MAALACHNAAARVAVAVSSDLGGPVLLDLCKLAQEAPAAWRLWWIELSRILLEISHILAEP